MIKTQPKIFDLEEWVFSKVKSMEILSFPEITRILGVNFHITRKQTFQLLKQWKKKGWIKIHPYHGVKFVKKE